MCKVCNVYKHPVGGPIKDGFVDRDLLKEFMNKYNKHICSELSLINYLTS